MKTTSTLACALLFAFFFASQCSAVRPGRCKRFARRQRRLAARDDFPDADCGSVSGSIRREINALCNEGLCEDLRRRACKDAVREALVVDIFPGECDDVPPCSPESCTANTCRSTVDLSLTYPANCPETCDTEGFCAETVCIPVTPSCGTGFIIDEATCSCAAVATTAPPTPVVTTAPPTASVSPTASAAPCTDCCTDTDPFDGVDMGCTTASPLCAAADGTATTGQGDCFVCQVGGVGCNASNPICAFSFAGFVGAAGTYGNVCFTCLNNSDDGVDEGCTAEEAFCDAPVNQAGSECVPECTSDAQCSGAEPVCVSGRCAVCSKDEYGTAPGCPATATVCGTGTGALLAAGQAGTECFFCENTASDLDPGCTAGVCVPVVGPYGNSCMTCQDTGAGTDLGCGAGAPNCVAAVPGGFGTTCA